MIRMMIYDVKRENFNILELKMQQSFSFYIVYKFRKLINNTDSKNISNVPPVSMTISQYTCHVNNGKCETSVEESLEKAISLNGGNSRCIAYDEYRNKGYCAYVQGVTRAQGRRYTYNADTFREHGAGAVDRREPPPPRRYPSYQHQNNHFCSLCFLMNRNFFIGFVRKCVSL